MSVKIIKETLTSPYFTFNAMAFIPSQETKLKTDWAIFTHGYTASKADNISWAQRLSEAGVPCVIFDLPGHHLGSYNEVNSFDDFKHHAHHCFADAYEFLDEQIDSECEFLILGGHSLGALLSLHALELEEFKGMDKLGIAVGLGIGQHSSTHLFESSFYQKTLNIRRQLVSSNLDSDLVFPWIKEEKVDMRVSGKRIHLITGEDDVVVGPGGIEAMSEELNRKGNQVTSLAPKRLSHHEPSLAASHIYHFLAKERGW